MFCSNCKIFSQKFLFKCVLSNEEITFLGYGQFKQFCCLHEVHYSQEHFQEQML